MVSDKVTPEVLNRLKVNPDDPRMKATVHLKEGGDRVYLFGDDVGAEKKSVYFKAGDSAIWSSRSIALHSTSWQKPKFKTWSSIASTR